MAVKLISLRNMMEDEIEDIRGLLDEAGFDYYETPAGLMGLGAATVWLKQKDDLEPAKSLLEKYNQERQLRVREEYEQLKKEGKQRTIKDEIKENPFRFFTYIAFAVFLIYITLSPFWG